MVAPPYFLGQKPRCETPQILLDDFVMEKLMEKAECTNSKGGSLRAYGARGEHGHEERGECSRGMRGDRGKGEKVT